MVLPGILDNLRMEKDTVPESNPNAADDDDEEYISVNTGDGKLVKVKTSKFESMQQSVELLLTIATELEGAFFDYVEPTANALMPLLVSTDEMSMLCDEARAASYQVWAMLIKVAQTGAQERGVQSPHANQL